MRATLTIVFLLSCNASAWAQYTVTPNVSYLGEDRAEKLDLYLPSNLAPGQSAPGIVLIHGGGWTAGDKADAREVDIAKALASRGYAVASINYRLGTTADPAWIDDLHDVKTAVQFLRANADTYHIADEIGAIGGSSGGHLALMAGLVQGGADPNGLDVEPQNGLYPGVSTSVQAVVNLYGIADLLTWEQPASDGTPVGVLKSDPNMTALVGVGRTVDPALWQYASPINHVQANQPPVLTLHGTADNVVDRNQALQLQAAMESAGATSQTYLIEGAGHTFSVSQIANLRDIRWLVGDFFDRHLKGAEQSVVVNETFTDNSFTNRVDPATDLPWIQLSADSHLSLVTDATLGTGRAIQDASTGDGRVLVNFSEVNLNAPGQSLVLAFDVVLPSAIPDAADSLRFGIYDSHGTMTARFQNVGAAGAYFGAGDDQGYAGFVSTGNVSGSSIQRELGQATPTTEDSILSQDGLTQLLATSGSLSDNLRHTIQFELERGANGMFVRLVLDGQDLGRVYDPTLLTTFNELVFGTSGALTYRLDNVTTVANLVLLPGAANHDMVVDGADYTVWADHFLLGDAEHPEAWSDGDFNGDSVVDAADYTIWADHFVPVEASVAAAVPEPSGLALAAIAVLGSTGCAARRRFS